MPDVYHSSRVAIHGDWRLRCAHFISTARLLDFLLRVRLTAHLHVFNICGFTTFRYCRPPTWCRHVESASKGSQQIGRTPMDLRNLDGIRLGVEDWRAHHGMGRVIRSSDRSFRSRCPMGAIRVAGNYRRNYRFTCHRSCPRLVRTETFAAFDQGCICGLTI